MLDLDAVRRVLASDARFSAWQITDVRGRSAQRYDVFGVPEARRIVETASLEVRVHVSHDGGTHIGESSFVVDVDVPIAAQLDAAFARARLVRNKRWTLPSPSSIAPVLAVDPRIVEGAPDACDQVMADIARALAKGGSVECCAAESFCDFRRVRLVNSRGLDLEREETSAYVEYVLLAHSPGRDETETYQSTRARRLDDLGILERVDGDAAAVSAALTADLPPSGTVDVVLSEQGIDEIFDAFVAHASGPAAWEGWSRFVHGKAIIDERIGEPLTITSDPTLPGGLASFAFDDTGLPGRKVDVVVDGRFAARLLDQRYACWLDAAPSSSTGNIVIGSGPRSEDDLLRPGARPLLRLLRFSQLSPHATTGAFSGEIRLGELIDDKGRHPVRGGSLTGNVFDAFRRAALSRERVRRGRLFAPRAVRLDAVTVTGG